MPPKLVHIELRWRITLLLLYRYLSDVDTFPTHFYQYISEQISLDLNGYLNKSISRTDVIAYCIDDSHRTRPHLDIREISSIHLLGDCYTPLAAQILLHAF